jgi:SH3-like domain-containing protein
VLMVGKSQGCVLRLNAAALFGVVLCLMPCGAEAQTAAADKLPRFASLRSDEVNLRVGPGENYPIEWVLKRKDMPIEIIEQFENWRRVQDWQGDKGWLLDRMITAKREVVVNGTVRALHQAPDVASPIVARAEPGVIARLIALQGPWCRIEADGYSGWLRRDEVWGVLADDALQ